MSKNKKVLSILPCLRDIQTKRYIYFTIIERFFMNKHNFKLLVLSLFVFAGQTALGMEGGQPIDTIPATVVQQQNEQPTPTEKSSDKEKPKTSLTKNTDQSDLVREKVNFDDISVLTLLRTAGAKMLCNTGSGFNWLKDSATSGAQSTCNTFLTKEYGASLLAIILGSYFAYSPKLVDSVKNLNGSELLADVMETKTTGLGAAALISGIAYPTYKGLAAGCGYLKTGAEWVGGFLPESFSSKK